MKLGGFFFFPLKINLSKHRSPYILVKHRLSKHILVNIWLQQDMGSHVHGSLGNGLMIMYTYGHGPMS